MRGGGRVVIALIFIIFNKERGSHAIYMAGNSGGRGGSNL